MLTDNSPMPYGKHKGKPMIDVPADYLLWLLDNDKCTFEVKDYITNSKEALEKEINKK